MMMMMGDADSFDFTLRDPPDGSSVVAGLWNSLADAANCAEENPTGRTLATAINGHPEAPSFAPLTIRMLEGVVMQAHEDPGAAAGAISRLSEFIVHLSTANLASALLAESNPLRRSGLLRDSVGLLSVNAVLRLTQATLTAHQRPLTPPIRDLLKKLGAKAVTGPPTLRAQALTEFRTLARSLLESCTTSQIHTVTHGFEDMFEHNVPRRTPGRVTPEAERLVQLSLETGAVGNVVWLALAEMVEHDRVRELLDLVKRAPESSPSAELIVHRIASARELSKLLAEEPVDFEAVDALLRGMGIGGATAMLEELAESKSRNTRRGLIERLARLGPEIASLVEPRLRDSRWFVVRNMLGLLREAGAMPDRSVVERFIQHTDPRVRREAFLLLMADPATHDRGLAEALKDTDRGVLRAALQAARSSLPDSAVPILAKRVADGDFPPEFRVLSLHLLGRTSSVLALDALLRYAQAGKTLLGKPRLAPRSPEMLAALSGLARSWSTERRAATLLNDARKSKDEQVVGAARVTASSDPTS